MVMFNSNSNVELRALHVSLRCTIVHDKRIYKFFLTCVTGIHFSAGRGGRGGNGNVQCFTKMYTIVCSINNVSRILCKVV